MDEKKQFEEEKKDLLFLVEVLKQDIEKDSFFAASEVIGRIRDANIDLMMQAKDKFYGGNA